MNNFFFKSFIKLNRVDDLFPSTGILGTLQRTCCDRLGVINKMERTCVQIERYVVCQSSEKEIWFFANDLSTSRHLLFFNAFPLNLKMAPIRTSPRGKQKIIICALTSHFYWHWCAGRFLFFFLFFQCFVWLCFASIPVWGYGSRFHWLCFNKRLKVFIHILYIHI